MTENRVTKPIARTSDSTSSRAAIFDFDPGDSVRLPQHTENVKGRVIRTGRAYVYVRWDDGRGSWESRHRPEELEHV